MLYILYYLTVKKFPIFKKNINFFLGGCVGGLWYSSELYNILYLWKQVYLHKLPLITYVRAQYIIKLSYIRAQTYINYPRAQNLINIGKNYLRAQSTYVHKNIKNKKIREKGAFRLPISVLCYDWNISVWLGSTNGSS